MILDDNLSINIYNDLFIDQLRISVDTFCLSILFLFIL